LAYLTRLSFSSRHYNDCQQQLTTTKGGSKSRKYNCILKPWVAKQIINCFAAAGMNRVEFANLLQQWS